MTIPTTDEMVGFCVGPAQCLTCAHEWAAVWPLGADPLACPRCEGDDTVRDMREHHDGI